MKYSAVGPIAVHLPERVESNADLEAEFPEWNMELIAEKTGIHSRHIAGDDECSSDLGVAAAKKLFEQNNIDPASIDFLLFCSQTPDYPLPTTACLIQERLGLKTDCGALDFNLGCSGYVYGLSLAEGLMMTGSVKRILLITAETYSKFIDRGDRSLRTIFGDGATATLLEPHDVPSLFAFQYGTDGSGADTLLVNDRCGFRNPDHAIQPRGRKRWKSDLYMDGPSLINFTVGKIPGLVDSILAKADMSRDELGLMLFHQATWKMLDQLHKTLDVTPEQLPVLLKDIGNTVSSTIPILIDQLRTSGKLDREARNMMVGFGVGWSWAGCIWQDIIQPGS